jgi:hypothetical protein
MVSGYRLIFVVCRGKQRGGGSAIFTGESELFSKGGMIFVTSPPPPPDSPVKPFCPKKIEVVDIGQVIFVHLFKGTCSQDGLSFC